MAQKFNSKVIRFTMNLLRASDIVFELFQLAIIIQLFIFNSDWFFVEIAIFIQLSYTELFDVVKTLKICWYRAEVLTMKNNYSTWIINVSALRFVILMVFLFSSFCFCNRHRTINSACSLYWLLLFAQFHVGCHLRAKLLSSI